MALTRTRWAAIGAAVAVTLGAGGISLGQAAISTGDKPVFVGIEPCRLVDTRPGDNNIGGRTTPLGANDTLTLQITGSTGQCSGIPADAVAAAMNVTAIQGSTRSYLSLYPADGDLPNASNLNWNGGDPPTPNKVDVALSPDGAVKLTNNAGTVHVAADLVGYYIDHTHDDRYYTKSQSDAALDKTKYVNLQTLRNMEADPLIGGPLRFETSLVVPPDYTSGTDMLLRLHVLKLDFGMLAECTVDLDPNSAYMHRPSTDTNLNDDGGSVTDGLEDPAPISFDAIFRQMRTIDITVSQPGTIPIQPGDSMTLNFFVDSSTCNASEVGMHSAALYYD